MIDAGRPTRGLRSLCYVAIVLGALTSHPLPAMQVADDSAEDPALKAEIDREALRGTRLDNDKKEQDIADARRKAITDALPSPTTSGKVEGKEGAGKMEASALAAAAINAVADDIARDIQRAAVLRSPGPTPTSRDICDVPKRVTSPAERAASPSGRAPVLLLAGSGTMTFSHWEQFRFRACAIQKEYQDALGTRTAPLSGNEGGGSAAGTLTAINVASKLLQMVTPDWEVGGIEVTATDKALLAAVADAYIGEAPSESGAIYWAGQVSKLGGSREVFEKLSKLDELDILAAKRIESLQPALAAAKKKLAAAKAGAAKEAAQKQVDALEKQIKPFSSARDNYAQLLKHLNGKESEALLPINQVVNQAAAERLLGDDGVILNLAIESTGGGYYSRRAIWDTLFPTSAPYWVSGGVVVNYLAVRPSDQRVVAAGLISCSAGYVRISRAAALTNNGMDRARCEPVAP